MSVVKRFARALETAAILAGLTAVISFGQEQAAPKISSETQLEIIDSICSALNGVYVFPEVAKEMETHLRRQYEAGAYKEATSTDVFAELLTAHLQEISRDRHLHVHFAPDDQARFYEDSLSDEEQAKVRKEMIKRSAYENFGFETVERMPGNIGYLKFNGFQESSYAGETAIAAMNFLAHCDAIIIDLRENGGGSPSMIQLISSYFFEEPVHLNSFYVRKEDSIKQFWTTSFVEGPRLTDIDLYVLTSQYTFSAAEEFTYNLKNLKRATIVGETTGGGAHPVDGRLFANLNVVMSLPFGRAINPITGTNWEGTGIEPDIVTTEGEALDVAYKTAVEKLAGRIDDADRRETLTWITENLSAKSNPHNVSEKKLKSYAGTYGPRRIIFENGVLYYQREGKPRYEMIPMSDSVFMFEDLDYFRLEVVTDAKGKAIELVGHYRGGHTDRSPRTK